MHIRSDVEVANLSDVGCERAANEDYFLYNEPEDDSEFTRRGRLMLIADGMGGRNGGEVASRLAAEVIRDVFLGGGRVDARCPQPRDVLITAFHQAHLAILSILMSQHKADEAEKQLAQMRKVTGNTGKQVAGAAEKTVGTAQRKLGEAADKARNT